MTDEERITPRYIGPDTSKRTEQMSREDIQGRFDKEVAVLYSQRDPIWLPEFRQMFALVPELFKPHLKADSIILDVGAGTGNLSRTVLEAIPDMRCGRSQSHALQIEPEASLRGIAAQLAWERTIDFFTRI